MDTLWLMLLVILAGARTVSLGHPLGVEFCS